MKCWDALDMLITTLNDPDLNVRCGAASGLGWLGHPSAVGPLIRTIEAAQEADDIGVRSASAGALGKLGHPDAVQVLERLLTKGHQDGTAVEREAAVRALGEIGHPSGFQAVKSALHDPSSWVRRAAVEAIVSFKHNAEAIESLIDVVTLRWTPEASAAVAKWLAQYKKSDAKADCIDYLADDPRTPRNEDDDTVRAMAARALGKLGDSSSIPTLVTALQEDQSFAVRSEAALALESLRAHEAVESLTSILNSDVLHQYLGASAARALGEIGDSGAIPALLVGYQSLNWDTYRASAEALIALGHPQTD